MDKADEKKLNYKKIKCNYNQDYEFNLFSFSKIFIFFVVIFAIHVIINLFLLIFKTDKTFELQQKKKFKFFRDIFPKINSGNQINNIKDLFNNRKLRINENNITNEYIQFIRPIDQKEEDKYNQILYKNILYDDFPNTKKNGQMNVNDFFNLVNKDKLVNINKINAFDEPKISIIIPVTTSKHNLIRSFNSIQSQTLKEIEIIISDDFTEDNEDLFKYLLENEPRLRIFSHTKKMGLWRTRIDGFLYSKGKYILHFDPGDVLADNFVLEDAYRFVNQYNLDTIRFSFSRISSQNFSGGQELENMRIYPTKHLKILYGRPDYDVQELGYGNIWNRLVRANVMTKGFNLIEIDLLNAYKDIWEDNWWNDLINRASFSNLIINKLGYISFNDRNIINDLRIKDDIEKDKTIREFIYCWYFDYELIPKNSNKTLIMDKLRAYSQNNNTYNNVPINLDYVKTYFPAYRHFLYILFKDPFIPDEEKNLIKILYNKVPKNKIKRY